MQKDGGYQGLEKFSGTAPKSWFAQFERTLAKFTPDSYEAIELLILKLNSVTFAEADDMMQ